MRILRLHDLTIFCTVALKAFRKLKILHLNLSWIFFFFLHAVGFAMIFKHSHVGLFFYTTVPTSSFAGSVCVDGLFWWLTIPKFPVTRVRSVPGLLAVIEITALYFAHSERHRSNISLLPSSLYIYLMIAEVGLSILDTGSCIDPSRHVNR